MRIWQQRVRLHKHNFFFFSIQKQICLSPSVFSPFFLNILLLETKVSFWFSFRKNKKIFPNVEKSRKINAFLPFTKKYSTEFQLWHTSCSYIGQKEKNKTTCPKQKRKAAVFGKGNPPPFPEKALEIKENCDFSPTCFGRKSTFFPKNKTDLPSVATEKGAKCFFLQKKTFVFSSKDFVSI